MTITQKAVDKGVNQKCNNNLDYKSNSFIMKVVVVHHNRWWLERKISVSDTIQTGCLFNSYFFHLISLFMEFNIKNSNLNLKANCYAQSII